MSRVHKEEIICPKYQAVEEYIAFCNIFIPKRGERMIERIKQLIK